MKTEIYEQKILIPDEGHYLYNKNDNIISNKVYLAKNGNPNDWQEITEEEKLKIEIEIKNKEDII
jgi:hypothetical protein